MTAHTKSPELVMWWTLYAVPTDFRVVFLCKYFNFIINVTMTLWLQPNVIKFRLLISIILEASFT